MAVVRACIFDVDGLLINSEDLYTEVMNDVLHAHGIHEDLPWSVKARQQSRGREGMIHVLKWAGLDMPVDDFIKECRAQQEIFRKSCLLPGVQDLLRTLTSTSNIEIAIASSAGRQMFHLKTDHLPIIEECIPEDHCVFGDDPEMQGKSVKPAPDVFLLALERLNRSLRDLGDCEIPQSECLVFEDSTAGVEAALRAGMQVVWVPHSGLRKVYHGREMLVLSGHSDSADDAASKATHASAEREAVEHANQPSTKIRAEMLESLKDFPYQRFGIQLNS